MAPPATPPPIAALVDNSSLPTAETLFVEVAIACERNAQHMALKILRIALTQPQHLVGDAGRQILMSIAKKPAPRHGRPSVRPTNIPVCPS